MCLESTISKQEGGMHGLAIESDDSLLRHIVQELDQSDSEARINGETYRSIATIIPSIGETSALPVRAIGFLDQSSRFQNFFEWNLLVVPRLEIGSNRDLGGLSWPGMGPIDKVYLYFFAVD